MLAADHSTPDLSRPAEKGLLGSGEQVQIGLIPDQVMAEETFDLSIEAQYGILNPIVVAQITRLTQAFSHKLKVDMAESRWLFINDDRTAKDLSKPFVFDLNWAGFQAYFQCKKPLYLYVEEPVIGLATKKGNFWVFFDPKIAQAYFYRQGETPKDFKKEAIKNFPYVDIKDAMAEQVMALLKRKDEKLINLIRQAEEYIAIADFFLGEDDAVSFNGMINHIIQDLGLKEVKALRQDITNPGASPTALERRLKSIFRICLRLYGKGHDSEKEGLKTLLSTKAIVRSKALELVEKKLANEVAP